MTSTESTKKKELSGDITPTKWIKSITPKGDVSWYVKWIASVFIIFGMMMTSLDVSFYPTNLYFHYTNFSIFITCTVRKSNKIAKTMSEKLT